VIYEPGWRVGRRVCRKEDETRVGTITNVDIHAIKVRWDSGRTSDYTRHKQKSIPLSEHTDKSLI
jgi:hypothetical protein